MSAPKMISETEAVKRERAAFGRGMRTSLRSLRRGTPEAFPDLPGDAQMIDKLAANFFPLPKVARPRVVRDPEWDDQWWKSEGGKLQFRIGSQPDDCWYPYMGYKSNSSVPCGTGYGITLDRVRVWADLLANPTELVEVDDDA